MGGNHLIRSEIFARSIRMRVTGGSPPASFSAAFMVTAPTPISRICRHLPYAMPVAIGNKKRRNLPIICFSSRSPEIISSGEVDSIKELSENPQPPILAIDHYWKVRARPEFKPDKRMLGLLFGDLLKEKDWNNISDLLDDLDEFDQLPDKYTCTRIVAVCMNARKFGIGENLLGVLERKKGPAAVSAFCVAMHAYNKLHMYRNTAAAYDRMKRHGLVPCALCYRSVMEAHRAMGKTDVVVSLFREYKSGKRGPSTTSTEIYSILCNALGRSRRADEALLYMKQMEGEGLSPNMSVYASVISSFAQVREEKTAEALFEEGRAKQMVKDPEVFMKLVMMYVDIGRMEKTLGVVKAMVEVGITVSDCISSLVVNGFVKKRGLKASLRAYRTLTSMGCKPGQVTYASMINVHRRLGQPEKAELLFARMMEEGYDKCVVAYSTMILMYGKLGRAQEAMRLLGKMKQKGCKPNVWVYNTLLDMHGRAGNPKPVQRIWNEMMRRNVAPDKISYTSIIGCYSKAGKQEECVRLYQEFIAAGGKVDNAMAGIMVAVFSKGSKFTELIEMLREMKQETAYFDRRLYESALNSFHDAGLQAHVRWLECCGFQEAKT